MWYWKMWNIGLYHASVRDTIIVILCDYCWNCICLFYPVTHWEMIVWHPCKFWLGPWGCGYRAKSRLRRPGEESGGWDLKGVGTDEPVRSQACELCIQCIYFFFVLIVIVNIISAPLNPLWINFHLIGGIGFCTVKIKTPSHWSAVVVGPSLFLRGILDLKAAFCDTYISSIKKCNNKKNFIHN